MITKILQFPSEEPRTRETSAHLGQSGRPTPREEFKDTGFRATHWSYNPSPTTTLRSRASV